MDMVPGVGVDANGNVVDGAGAGKKGDGGKEMNNVKYDDDLGCWGRGVGGGVLGDGHEVGGLLLLGKIGVW